MNDPYQPPEMPAAPVLSTEEVLRKRRFWGRMIWVGGIVLVLAPLNGIIAISTHLSRAFGTLAKTGAADPAELAQHISMVLLTTFYSFIFALPVLGLLFLSIIRYRRFGRQIADPGRYEYESQRRSQTAATVAPSSFGI